MRDDNDVSVESAKGCRREGKIEVGKVEAGKSGGERVGEVG